MGNSIITNSLNFIVKVYVDNHKYNKGLAMCVIYTYSIPIAAWSED